ncbi:hypothetical protein [Rosistilla oblonga]|uniref:Ferric reductase like transmembrane component n=1 Tax=Rosistilla oblonga TaxID=2527990 RepID=A0A518IQ52_9BACT|nr:hypothetical protein [Rosistilla oblonga]QDV55226.1 hypothetical protein Mal33_11960 [Rosistilla oblonga]
MLHKRTRRTIALSLTATAVLIAAIATWLIRQRLGHASMATGWTLLASVGLLMLLGLRKKLVMLPILPVRVWTQFHIYTGLFALAIYLMHVPVVIASGFFESTLSLLFLSVAGSGLYGVWISRRGAKRLTAIAGEYRFDRFGWHRRTIADRASEIVTEVGQTGDVPVIAKFYRERLQQYFSTRPSLAYVLVPTSHRKRRLLTELGELDRYFASNVKQAAGRLAALIRNRDDLDYHYATQLRMRMWLAIHIALTVAMLVFIVVHVLMVLRFQGA